MPRRYGPDGTALWNGKAPEEFSEADVYRFMAETEEVLQKRELLGGESDARSIAQRLAEGRTQAARDNAARPAKAHPWGWQTRLPWSAFPLRRGEVCAPRGDQISEIRWLETAAQSHANFREIRAPWVWGEKRS